MCLDSSTVMGPGMGLTPGNDMLLPPRLTHATDKFKWRKRVLLWVTTVKRFSKGGDKRAKGILSALGLTLYNALDQVFSTQVEQSIAAGEINLEGDDNEVENANKQINIVTSIIELVAKDSPTDGIRRLVQMMREVFSCTRKTGESPALFARRFQALALDYLNHCDTATIQQDNQNFAMLLLENSKISASVYSSIITRLVSMIASRSGNAASKIFVISKDRLEAIKERAGAIRNQVQGVDSITQLESVRAEHTRAIIYAVTATIDANELHVKQDRTIFRITLDDAVEVLKDLKVEDGDDDVRRIGAMLGKRDFRDNDQEGNRGRNSYYASGRDKKQKTHIPNGQGPKSVSRCHNCKEPNHWYRDPECIYNVIKALMEGKEIATDVVQKLSPTVRNLFKDENGNFKSKIPVSELVGSIGNGNGSSDLKDISNEKFSSSYFR